ncbi:hypothetical protein HDV01_007640 [Terramyces sp. JEL0728]|nr:hypothetical protein HDV01_007640 [Terramyces sp. JEL0728]
MHDCGSESIGYKGVGVHIISVPRYLSVNEVLWALTFFNAAHFESQAQNLAHIPKLFIIGDSDNFTLTSTWKSMVEKVPEPKNISVVPQADHFWGRHTPELVRLIDQWAVSVL